MSAPARQHRTCSGDLLCRECAAAALGVSADGFDRHVRSSLPLVKVGELPRWRRSDLRAWIDARIEGPCANQKASTSGYTASAGSGEQRSPGSASLDRLANEIEARLTKSLRQRGSEKPSAQVYQFPSKATSKDQG